MAQMNHEQREKSAARTRPVNLIGRYLSADNVVLDLDVNDKYQALSEIALLVGRRFEIDHRPVERALWRREQTGTTGIGYGVAIPHARIPGISNPIILFARTRRPIKFGAPDHKPVANLFVILVSNYATEEHLRILACVSSMFSSAEFRERLAAAVRPQEVHELFNGWPVD
jgi:PTS system nitrogen regulatory IIA component